MKKIKKKYKIMLLILIIILIICLGYCSFIIIKGNIVYGAKACACDYTGYSLVGLGSTSWKCNLCGHEDVDVDTGVPELCDRCAFITGRCAECGNIKK